MARAWSPACTYWRPDGIEDLAERGTRREIMTTTKYWRSAGTWGLLGLMFLLFALVVEPAPALAEKAGKAAKAQASSDTWDLSQIWVDTNALADVVLYEV